MKVIFVVKQCFFLHLQNSEINPILKLTFCLPSLIQDSEKRTPLHAAAYLGDAEIIELLILSGMVPF